MWLVGVQGPPVLGGSLSFFSKEWAGLRGSLEGLEGSPGGGWGWAFALRRVCGASRGWTVVLWLGRQQPRSATCDLSVAFGWGCVLLRQPLLTALSRGPLSSGCAVDWGDSLRWPGYFQQPWPHPSGEPRGGDGSPATEHFSCKVSRVGAAWGRDGGTVEAGQGAVGCRRYWVCLGASFWPGLSCSSPVGPPPQPSPLGMARPGPVCREGRTLGLWALGLLVGRAGLCSLLARGLGGDEGCRAV